MKEQQKHEKNLINCDRSYCFFLLVTQVLIKETQIEAHVSPSVVSGTKDSWRYGLSKCTVGNFRMNLLPC